MARDVHQIRIDSILGGQSLSSHLSAKDQFLYSVNIDPSLSISNSIAQTSGIRSYSNSSSLIHPVAVANVVSSSTMQVPAFIVPNPKNDIYYVYGSGGSVYTHSPALGDFTALSDGGSMSNVTNCGAAYYDNYIYFSKDTTVARYGPLLGGTPAFDGDYWVGTLGKTQLTDYSTFINDWAANDSYPQHIMHRHSDGRLYFADRLGSQASLNYISTTKTTVEGDTNNGSTYSALSFGYGLYITAIESLGSNLVIALYENQGNTANNAQRGQRAKIAIWDTNSQNFNFITNNEFPDELISAMKNINGTLYLASGNRWHGGFRVSHYVGGYSFEEDTYISTGQPPFSGAMLGNSERLIFGSDAIYSLGLSKSGLSRGLFKYQTSINQMKGVIYSLAFDCFENFTNQGFLAGWYNVVTGTSQGLDIINPTAGGGYFGTGNYATPGSVWASQIFKIGQPFKITKINIPLAQALDSGSTIIPTIFFDSFEGSKTLTTINSSNYGTNRQMITLRPINLTADSNFFLELQWTGTSLAVVSLPITIEYELLDVDTAYP